MIQTQEGNGLLTNFDVLNCTASLRLPKHTFLRDRQDKTTLFYQGSPVSCKAGILRGPGKIDSNTLLSIHLSQREAIKLTKLILSFI